MRDSCPTCGQAVTVVTSDQGTNAYIPAEQNVMHDDVLKLLDALGLGTFARPESPHEVVNNKIIPAVAFLRGRVDALDLARERAKGEQHAS